MQHFPVELGLKLIERQHSWIDSYFEWESAYAVSEETKFDSNNAQPLT